MPSDALKLKPTGEVEPRQWAFSANKHLKLIYVKHFHARNYNKLSMAVLEICHLLLSAFWSPQG